MSKQDVLTDTQLCRKVAKILKKWKNDDNDFDDLDALFAIDDLFEENGYDTGEAPDSWATW